MNRTYNKNTIIATVVVIALLIAIIGCLAFALSGVENIETALEGIRS